MKNNHHPQYSCPSHGSQTSSQPKPKIVYKNLEEIIKKNQYQALALPLAVSVSVSQKRKSVTIPCGNSENRGSNNNSNSKNVYPIKYQNENAEHQSHKITYYTETSQSLPLRQSKFLNNNKSSLNLSRTSSRHSLQSKDKINYLPQKEKTIKPVSVLQKSNNKNEKKSQIYNRADAIFTDLQDFLLQSKQSVLNSIQKNDSAHVQKQLDKFQLAIQGLKNSINLNYSSKNSIKRQESLKTTSQFNCFQDYIMNRQTTLTSTINGDPQQNMYIPTQTDDQLMNCLSFKNKVNSRRSNRKMQVTLQPKAQCEKTTYQLVLQQSKRKKFRS